MNFSELLQSAYEAQVAPRVAERVELRRQLAAIKTQIEAEQTVAEEAEADIGKLRGLVGQTVVLGGETYQELENSLERRTADRERHLSRAQRLEGLVPGKVDEIAGADRRVEEARQALARAHLHLAQDELNRRVHAAVEELYDGWIVAHMSLAVADGDSFSTHPDVLPQIRDERIDARFPGLVTMLPWTQYVEAARGPKPEPAAP